MELTKNQRQQDVDLTTEAKKKISKLYKKHPSEEITSLLIRIGGMMANNQVDEVEVYSFIQIVFLELERSIRKNDKLVFTDDVIVALEWLFTFHDEEKINEILIRHSHIITQENESLNDFYQDIVNIFLTIERGLAA